MQPSATDAAVGYGGRFTFSRSRASRTGERFDPGFLRGNADNHPFTMTTIPAVLSAK
jgi:hypothetical protein